MQMRLSSLRGMLVVDDNTQETVAFLQDPLIDVDTGRIIGFFIGMFPGFGSGVYFLSAFDVLSIGTKVHVRSVDRLSPPDELIRLQASLKDPRSFLGQDIRIKDTGRSLGVCADVQFDTRHFAVSWMFPRRFFFERQAIPIAEVLEVTEEAIWIKDPLRLQGEDLKQRVALVTDVAI